MADKKAEPQPEKEPKPAPAKSRRPYGGEIKRSHEGGGEGSGQRIEKRDRGS